MRFRIEVNTLDGKLTYERDSPADALAVAEGGKQSLGVRIVDSEDLLLASVATARVAGGLSSCEFRGCRNHLTVHARSDVRQS